MSLPKWATTVTPLSKTLALIIFITFPIFGFFLGMQYQKALIQINSVKNTNIEAENAQLTKSLLGNKNFAAYKITIIDIKKPTINHLEIALSDLFLKEKYLIENLRIFTDDYQTILNEKEVAWYVKYINKPLFILISGRSNDLEINKIYESDFLSIKVEDATSIAPYLKDRKYCIQESDCLIRYDWCNKGSWNRYSEIIPQTGCQFGNNEGQTPEIIRNLQHCAMVGGSGIIAEYSGNRCINNKCSALNPKFQCANDTDTYINDMIKLFD